MGELGYYKGVSAQLTGSNVKIYSVSISVVAGSTVGMQGQNVSEFPRVYGGAQADASHSWDLFISSKTSEVASGKLDERKKTISGQHGIIQSDTPFETSWLTITNNDTVDHTYDVYLMGAKA
jgi:hypothetical protein